MLALDIKVKLEGDLEKEFGGLAEKLAYQIPAEARRIMDESTPRGRLYRRGRITGALTKRGLASGLRRVTATRMQIGSRIHRASSPGQPPAKDSGNLYRNIRVRKTGKDSYKVIFEEGYAGYLEFNLNRPFALPAVEAAVKKVFV